MCRLYRLLHKNLNLLEEITSKINGCVSNELERFVTMIPNPEGEKKKMKEER